MKKDVLNRIIEWVTSHKRKLHKYTVCGVVTRVTQLDAGFLGFFLDNPLLVESDGQVVALKEVKNRSLASLERFGFRGLHPPLRKGDCVALSFDNLERHWMQFYNVGLFFFDESGLIADYGEPYEYSPGPSGLPSPYGRHDGQG